MTDNRCGYCGRDFSRPCLGCPQLGGGGTPTDRNQRRRELRAELRGTVACAVCGTTFTPPRAGAVTCSSKCRQKSYRNRKVGPDRRLTAYHEAGHAVVALELGSEVLAASVRHNARLHALGLTNLVHENRGRVFILVDRVAGRYRRRTPAELHADAEERTARVQAVVLLAGYVAERMLDPEKPVEWYDGGWLYFPTGPAGGHDDMAQADAIARRLYPKGTGAYSFLDRSYARAVRILQRRWPAVVRIAEALLERRKLTGPEVVALADLRRRHLP